MLKLSVRYRSLGGVGAVEEHLKSRLLVVMLCSVWLVACGANSSDYGGDDCSGDEQCPEGQTCIMEGLGYEGYCAPNRSTCDPECAQGLSCVFSPPSAFGQTGCRSNFTERALDEYCHTEEVCQSKLCAVSVWEEEEAPTLGVCMMSSDACDSACEDGWVCATRPSMNDRPHCARVVIPED